MVWKHNEHLTAPRQELSPDNLGSQPCQTLSTEHGMPRQTSDPSKGELINGLKALGVGWLVSQEQKTNTAVCALQVSLTLGAWTPASLGWRLNQTPRLLLEATCQSQGPALPPSQINYAYGKFWNPWK